jgi:hypothetical protein
VRGERRRRRARRAHGIRQLRGGSPGRAAAFHPGTCSRSAPPRSPTSPPTRAATPRARTSRSR